MLHYLTWLQSAWISRADKRTNAAMLIPVRRMQLVTVLAVVLLAGVIWYSSECFAQGGASSGPSVSMAEAPDWDFGWNAWARPLPEGPIRCLMIAPSHALRDAVELSRQIDIDLDIAAVHDVMNVLDSEASTTLGVQLDRKLDAIILADIDAENLPVSIHGALIDKIREGTGLVRVSYGSTPFPALQRVLDTLESMRTDAPITRGTAALGPFAVPEGPPVLRMYEGMGTRTVEIGYATPRPSMHCLVPGLSNPAVNDRGFLEAQFSAVARAVLWAAGRAPAITIEHVENLDPKGPDVQDTPPRLPQEFVQTMRDAALPIITHSYRIRLSAPAPKDYEVRIRLRYPHKQIRWSRVFAEQKIAKGENSGTFYISHASGDSLLDVWLMDDESVVDWYTLSVHVDGWPEIDNVTYSKFAVKTNDALTISFDVRPHYHRPRPATAYARASDPRGRVVADKYVPVSAEGGRVQATLGLTNLDVEQLRVELFVADTPHGPFGPWNLEHSTHHVRFVPVADPQEPPFGFIAEGIASAEPNVRGLNRTLAAAGVDTIRLLPERPDALGLTFDNLGVLPNLFMDNAGVGDAFQRDAAAYSRLGAKAYCLVGEKSNSWDLYRAARAALREVDEHAQLGLLATGSGASDLGPDWNQSASRIDFLRVQPGGTAAEIVRSLRGRDQSRYIHLNSPLGSPSLLEARQLPWYAALHGMNGVWLSNTYEIAGVELRDTALYPDGRLKPWFAEATKAVEEVRTGYGLLLSGARRDHSGIAILSSRSSARFNAAAGDEGINSDDAEPAAINLLERLGFQFDMISAEEVAEGALADYDVLILPAARALDEQAIDAAAIFASGGGTLIADFIPGRFDSDGVARASNSLNPVFGVGQIGKTKLITGALALRMASPPGKRKLPVLPGLRADGSVVAGDAFVGGHVGPTPVWLIRDTGKGLTVLLNHSFSDSLDSQWFQSLFDGWLARGGARKILPRLLRKGSYFEGERVLYHYGEAQVVALLSSPDASERVQKLRPLFPEDRHVYTMRNGENLGRSKSATVKLGRGEVGLYSSLPYEVSRVVVDTPGNVQGGRVPVEVSVRTRERLPGRHLVYVSLMESDGEGPPLVSRILECSGGEGSTYLPVALNISPGTYTVAARDVLTGIRGSAQIILVAGAL